MPTLEAPRFEAPSSPVDYGQFAPQVDTYPLASMAPSVAAEATADYVDGGIEDIIDYSNSEFLRRRDELAAGELALQASDIRPGEEGRVTDINEAYELAKEENRVFDEKRAEAEAAAEAEHQQALQKEALESSESSKADADGEKTTLEVKATMKTDAEKALKEAGYLKINESLPDYADVHRDLITGNLVIKTGPNNIKILEPQVGAKPRIKEYAFNPISGKLTIRSGGVNTLVDNIDKYNTVDNGQKAPEAIALPSAVAEAIGYDRAVRVGSQPPKAQA